MSKPFLPLAVLLLSSSALVFAQNSPASDPQALAFAAQSITAMTGGANINDVTLTASVTWNGTNSGTATLQALGMGESRIDLALPRGTLTEIRDAQMGIPLGKWINVDNSSGHFAAQNCWTDAVWFFPILGSLAAGPNVVLAYVGEEIRNGVNVQHIQSYIFQINSKAVTPDIGRLSTVDFYLDAGTLFPIVVTFNTHPDRDSAKNIPVEIDFGNYQTVGGVTVPTHIQKYLQGTLITDLEISAASFNTGIPLSSFSIN